MARNWRAFEEYVNQLMKEESIPGVAVAVSKDGELIYQQGFGERDITAKKSVTPHTLFGIASITKSFTALAIMKLAQEGKLSIQDPVTKYLPDFQLHGIENMEEMKIHHLLSHTTGLAPMKRREDLNKLDDHVKYLAEKPYDLLGKPGAYFSYCNDTFLLSGAIIERLTGQLYRRYITEHILSPLRMHHSTYSLEEVQKWTDVSVPYEYDQQEKSWREVAWPKLGNYEVGGGIRSNVLDLIKYGQVYINANRAKQILQLDHDTVKRMWQPVTAINEDQYYGYGLTMMPDYAGFTLVEHGGGQPGVSSNFGFVPEENLVAVVLTNVSAVPAGDIWLSAVNTALDLPLEQKRRVEPQYDVTLETFKRIAGTYQSAEGGRVRMFLDENDTPKAEIAEDIFTLRASGPNTVVITENEKPIQIFRDEQGTPWAIRYGVRMLLKR